MRRIAQLRHAAAPALALLLAGCSSLGGLAPQPSAPAFDLASADLALALFAVDLPASVRPAAQGPRVTYAASPGLDVTLVPADAEPVVAALQPPAAGRSYVVYAFAPEDQPKVRAAQSGGARPGATFTVIPRLCVTAEARKNSDTIAVHAVLPGRQAVQVIAAETLLSLEARAGAPLPACAGHSG
jgi:hypothetical protein